MGDQARNVNEGAEFRHIDREEESLNFAAYLASPENPECLDAARHDDYESKAKKFAGCSRKQLCFLFGGKFHRFDEFTRFCFT